MSFLSETYFKPQNLDLQVIYVVSESISVTFSVLRYQQVYFCLSIFVLRTQLVKRHLFVDVITVLLRLDEVNADGQVGVILLIADLLPQMLEKHFPQ